MFSNDQAWAPPGEAQSLQLSHDGLVGADAANEIVTVVGNLDTLGDIAAVIRTCAAGSR